MRLVWVQQWAVLPVIVEDREMVEENSGQGGRLPPGGQPMDPSARRLSEREGTFQPRTFLSNPQLLHFTFHTSLPLLLKPCSN